ncbi:MAG: PAS domain S-box protein, partial [Myxococcota bacterium]
GRVTQEVLDRNGIPVATFTSLPALCDALAEAGGGAVLVSEEAVHKDRDGVLAGVLSRQPAWSDLPVLVLTSGDAPGHAKADALDRLGNVTLVDRPVRIATLVSTLRSALRARARQYQLRRHLEERQRDERALAESEARYRAIGETIPFGAWTAGVDGRIDHVSDAFLQLVGMTRAEVAEIGWHHHAAPKDVERLRAEWARGIEGGALFDIECGVVATDGVVHTVLVRGVPLRDEGGAVQGWVGMNLDVTEKRRLEEEFARIGRLESVALLAGGIAHDFNNILTAILANVSLVKRLVPPGSASLPRVEAALRAGGQAQSLVRQLLTFAKGGAPILRTVRLQDLLAEAVGFALQGSAVRAEVNAPPGLWTVEADPGQLLQVLHNLVLNASQAMDGAGTVRVSAQNVVLAPGSPLPLEAGRYVRVSVVDHGRGIPAERSRGCSTSSSRRARGAAGSASPSP